MIRVLIVDDEPSILEGVKKLIHWEELGIAEVLLATSGEEALRMLEDTSIQILITDICMKPMSGLELIQEIKRRNYDIKCIVESGYDDFCYVKQTVQLGIENYLLKPINQDELISTILQCIDTIQLEKKENTNKAINENIIRNNILLRWLNRCISAKELEERSSTLSISLNNECFYVLVLSDASIVLGGDRAKAWDEKMSDLMEYFSKRILGQVDILYNMKNQLVIIFHGKKEEYEGNKEKILSGLHVMKQCMDLKAYGAIGHMVHSYQQVPDSYEYACSLLHVNTSKETNTLRDGELDKQEKHSLEYWFAINIDDIKPCILVGEEEELNKKLHEITKLYTNSQKKEDVWGKLVLQQLVFTIASCVSSNDSSRFYQQAEQILYQIHYNKCFSFHENIATIANFARDIIGVIKVGDDSKSPVIRSIMQILNQEYSNEWNLRLMASKFKMNPVYLGQLFRSEVGDYFSEYLNKIRINVAKEYLRNTDKTILEIGTLVGYSSKAHFFSVFKKVSDQTPMEYRRIHAIE